MSFVSRRRRVGFHDGGNIDRRSSRLNNRRRVNCRVHNSAFSRAVRNFRSTAGHSDFLGAVNSAGLLGNRGDRSSHLNGLRLGQADDRRVCRSQS
jgi:hypothetical protein